MDTLVFRCPGCQQPFQVLAEQAGQMVRCPSCEEPVKVPAQTLQTEVPQPEVPQEKVPQTREPQANSEPAKEPVKTTLAQTHLGDAKTEEVQSYGCPECDKPFGIYESMFGSKMACPHCHKIVLLQKAEVPSLNFDAVTKPEKLKRQPQSKKEKRTQPDKKKPENKTTVTAKMPTAPTAATGQNEIVPPTNIVADDAATTDAAPASATASPTAATAFTPLPVDHLLPPKFQAVDPAFFYRRHQDGSQVLLPGGDGSVNVVDNRIVRIEHNGKVYELISSPSYDRLQRSVVTNLLAVVICGLVIAIVMTLLNQ